MKIYKKVVLVFASLVLVSCTTSDQKTVYVEELSSSKAQFKIKRKIASSSDDVGMAVLPTLKSVKVIEDYVIKSIKRGRKLDPQKTQEIAQKIAHYVSFLNIDPSDRKVRVVYRTIKTTGEKREVKYSQNDLYKNVMSRLLNSSTQFILCESFADWECLEKKSELIPKSLFRQDAADDLGVPVVVNQSLKIKPFFSDQWDIEESKVDRSQTLAKKLSEIIDGAKWDELLLAIYGIDDLKDSLAPVYDAIVAQKDNGADVRAVVDIGPLDIFSKKTPYHFSHIPYLSNKPTVYALNEKLRTNIDFEYTDSVEFVKKLNEGIAIESEAKARWEMPDNGIMHNKFIIFNKDNKRSVWTGTANISRNCMGTERNSNLGVYIQSDAIAQAFQDEFEEMYVFDEKPYIDKKRRFVNRRGMPQIMAGHFHRDKRPNTNRYFLFEDGNEVRVNFSPTDDAEHRIIIPMLLTAQPGDEIRIAMYYGGGFEYVRALQYAIAKGAKIKIAFDKVSGANASSWVNSITANLRDPNPYTKNPEGSIIVRMNTWTKLNHHKSATLTRIVKGHAHVEMIVFGSQNWSQEGNDSSDENIIAIRNLNDDVPMGSEFNKYFDERLWPASAAGEINLKEQVVGVTETLEE